MTLNRFTAKELVGTSLDSLKRSAQVDGFIIYVSGEAWIAADDNEAKPVVVLASPDEIYDAFKGEVSARFGGRFLYVNRGTATGTLASDDDGYVLTDISTIEIWDDDELVHLSLNGANPNRLPDQHQADPDPDDA